MNLPIIVTPIHWERKRCTPSPVPLNWSTAKQRLFREMKGGCRSGKAKQCSPAARAAGNGRRATGAATPSAWAALAVDGKSNAPVSAPSHRHRTTSAQPITGLLPSAGFARPTVGGSRKPPRAYALRFRRLSLENTRTSDGSGMSFACGCLNIWISLLLNLILTSSLACGLRGGGGKVRPTYLLRFEYLVL